MKSTMYGAILACLLACGVAGAQQKTALPPEIPYRSVPNFLSCRRTYISGKHPAWR